MSRGKPLNLEGQRFGRLIVIKRVKTPNENDGHIYWLCQCDCGNTAIVRGNRLISGITTSCGCYKKVASIKHGMFGTRIYQIWANMKRRCNNPDNIKYKNYGGRGIIVCEEWNKDFMTFYNWAINNGYSDKLTIDRINVNGNYEPNNCRWTDMKTQQSNRTNNCNITFNEETHTITEWERITKISSTTIQRRLKNGWSVEDALTIPTRAMIYNQKRKNANDSNIQELQSVKPNDS